MSLTKAQLEALNVSSFPNNNSGLITPEILRVYNSSSIAATVNQDVYTTESASFSSRILAVTGSSINTGSFATTGSNTFTGNQTISQSKSIILGNSGSINTISNGSTEYSSTAGLSIVNTTSGELDISQYGVSTARLFHRGGGAVEISGSSTYISDVNFIPFSASLNSRIIAVTGSSINTGSFATTGSNSFVGNQRITGSLSVTVNIETSGSTGHTTINEGAIYVQNTDDSFNTQILPADIQAQINTGDIIGMTPSASANSGLDGTWLGPSIYTAYDGAYRPMFGFQSQNTWTDGRITALKPLVVSGSLLQTGSTSFSELTGSLASFSSSLNSRIIAATGSAGTTFPYTGSAIITGSLVVTGSITERGDLFIISPKQTIDFSNISSSNKGNIIFGVPDYSDGTFQSGSVVISGSNNILFQGNPQNTNGYYSYVSGSLNILGTPINVSTASVNNPSIDSNYINRPLTLNVVSQSLAAPNISSNILFGGGSTNFNHQSGSFSFRGNILGGNNIFTSNQNITKGVATPQITGNSMMGTVTLNHYSSSIGFDRNTTNGLSAPIVDNYVSSSFGAATNGIAVNRNFFIGNTITIHASGSAASATTRTFADNLIGGGRNTISSSYVNSNNAHLISSIVYGEGLIVSASHTSTTVGGTAFFGRYNDTTAGLNSSQNVIFAVGGGTSTSARKTPLYITTGSAVFVSGSLSVTGSSTFSGSMAVSGTINTITISSAGDVTASRFLATSNAGGTPGAFAYSAASSGGVANTFNTALGKDFLDLYQYQGQPYAFNLHLTSDQLNIYSGSQFSFQLQTNGSGASQFGGATYYALASGSYTSSVGAGSPITGLDQMGNNNGGFEINDFKAPSIFEKSLLINGGLFISASNAPKWGGGLNIEGSNAGYALKATGSVIITGSLQLNGSNVASLDSNTFSNTQIVSSSIYIAPNNNNNQLYLPSGSNKQTGLATLDGGNPGAVVVSNTNVTANSIIMLTKQTLTNAHMVAVSSKGSNTFTITSNGNGDSDVVAFMIINPS